MGRLRSAMGGFLVGALAAGFAGCGEGTVENLRIGTVVEQTESVGSARFEGTRTNTGPSGKEIVVEVEGEIDFAHGASATRSSAVGPGGRTVTSEERTIERAIYRTGELDGFFSESGKPWTRYDLPASGGRPFELSLGVGSEFLDVLAGGATSTESLGDDEVRGDPVTGYRVELPDTTPDELVAEGVRFGPTTYEVWIDDRDRLRRLNTASDGGTSRSTVEYFDFGVPVAIEAPPADQVETLTNHDSGSMSAPPPPPAPGCGPRPAGDWQLVQEVRDGDRSSRLYRVPAEDGYMCFTVESDPPEPDPRFPPGIDRADLPPEVRESIEAEGHQGRGVSLCAPLAGLDDSTDPLVLTSDKLTDGRRVVYGGVAPETLRVTARFKDGRTRVVEPVNHTILLVVPVGAKLDWLSPDVGAGDLRCPYDPDLISCEGQWYG